MNIDNRQPTNDQPQGSLPYNDRMMETNATS